MNEMDRSRLNTFLIILLKAAVLVLIVLCIFFIAYPHACVNLIQGRETEESSISDINKPLIPASTDVAPSGAPASQYTPPPVQPAEEARIKDTNTAADMQEKQAEQQAAQDAFDYDVVKRYVELEKEYLKTHPNNSETANALTAQVMQEKNITAQDWQEIIMKANEKGWFKELRGQ